MPGYHVVLIAAVVPKYDLTPTYLYLREQKAEPRFGWLPRSTHLHLYKSMRKYIYPFHQKNQAKRLVIVILTAHTQCCVSFMPWSFGPVITHTYE